MADPPIHDPRIWRTAYFAGLIDGEGCVAVRRKKWPSGHIGLVPIIIVGMSCERTIRALHEHFGVGRVRECHWHQKKNPRHKTLWYWEAAASHAREVARQIAPYSITKADRVAEIMALPEFRRGGPDGEKTWHSRFTQEQIDAARAEWHEAQGTTGRAPPGWLTDKATAMGVGKNTLWTALRYGYGLPNARIKKGRQ